MDLKETQSTDSKRNSNHGLKRKTTETKRDRRWAYGARDRWLWRCDNGGANIDEEDSGGETWRWSTSSAVVDVLSGSDGIDGKWLMGQQQLSVDLWVSTVGGLAWVTFPSFFFFFFFFVVCGLWVLWSEAGMEGGHRLGSRHWLLCWLGGEKLMWGLQEYTDCRGWFRLVQDLWADRKSVV